jgi:hypothetical protein
MEQELNQEMEQGKKAKKQVTSKTLVAFCIVLAIVVGASTALALVNATPPATLGTGVEPDAIPVDSKEVVDSHSVSISVVGTGIQNVSPNIGGVLTAYTCQIKKPVKSGTSFVSIDDTPLLAFSTEIPFYRSLSVGDKGADAGAVKKELKRLGYKNVSSGNVFDSGAYSALSEVAKKANAPKAVSKNTVDLSYVIWLPTPKTLFNSCDAKLGDEVAPKDKIATVPSKIKSATVLDIPDDAIEGERILDFGNTTIPFSANSLLSSKDLLEIEQSEAYLSALSGGGDGMMDDGSGGDDKNVTLTADYDLKTPVQASVVSPGSVIIDGENSCVVSGNKVLPVLIIGSELGKSFIVFKDASAIPSEVMYRPAKTTKCV